MERGKSWSSNEDIFLARSVVHVSHDHIVGVDQKSSKFYYRVLQQFQVFVPNSNRTSDTLCNRWKEIQSSCSKFAGHFAISLADPKSGQQEDYYIEEALEIYVKFEKSSFKFRQI
uniref:Myb-like domain-containing protein n=1 Tax=Physcomitrium patens TaxID=3218 RepID=A0A2K1JPY2_PHYPA|nr:hypothetical protein PHYPA_015952 [Physcomitrium patens]